MPNPTSALTVADAFEHVRKTAFTPTTESQVGIEVEWNVESRDHSYQRSAVDSLAPRLRGSLSVEPGGQLEIASLPGKLPDVLADTAHDAGELESWLAERGARLLETGCDSNARPRRVLDAPRYAAMESYFRDGDSSADPSSGPAMMCTTASVQVNLDLGPDDRLVDQWHVLEAISPPLIAAFANSPFANGRPNGWVSNRMRLWFTIDPTRTAAVGAGRRAAEPGDAWAEYALAARVMLIRESNTGYRPALMPLTLADWVTNGHDLGYPTLDDIDYHLTTLFPPVRPRGWVEVRVADMVPTPYWQVPAAVMSALVHHADVDSRDLVRGSAGRWIDSARAGLRDDALADDAARCFRVACESLDRAGEPALAALVDEYADRYVARRRAPADDTLEAT